MMAHSCLFGFIAHWHVLQYPFSVLGRWIHQSYIYLDTSSLLQCTRQMGTSVIHISWYEFPSSICLCPLWSFFNHRRSRWERDALTPEHTCNALYNGIDISLCPLAVWSYYYKIWEGGGNVRTDALIECDLIPERFVHITDF